MDHRIAPLLLTIGTMFALGGPVEGQTVKKETQPALDHFGDPLPEGALARLGPCDFAMGDYSDQCACHPMAS